MHEYRHSFQTLKLSLNKTACQTARRFQSPSCGIIDDPKKRTKYSYVIASNFIRMNTRANAPRQKRQDEQEIWKENIWMTTFIDYSIIRHYYRSSTYTRQAWTISSMAPALVSVPDTACRAPLQSYIPPGDKPRLRQCCISYWDFCWWVSGDVQNIYSQIKMISDSSAALINSSNVFVHRASCPRFTEPTVAFILCSTFNVLFATFLPYFTSIRFRIFFLSLFPRSSTGTGCHK